VARETIDISERGSYVNSGGGVVPVKDDLDRAVVNSVHYEHGFDFRRALAEHDDGDDDDDGGGGVAGGGGEEEEEEVAENEAAATTTTTTTTSTTTATTTGGMVGWSQRPAYPPPIPPAAAVPRRLLRPRGGDAAFRFPKTSFLVVSASWLESALELLRAQRSSSSSSSSSSSPSPSSSFLHQRHHHHRHHPTSSGCLPGGGGGGGGGESRGSYRVGVLHSGSGTTPGGRFLKGTVSQEDCLCRASLLYSCISQPRFQSEGRFYGKNRGMRYGTSNCVIFSPGEIL
jgi:hypothetical protein